MDSLGDSETSCMHLASACRVQTTCQGLGWWWSAVSLGLWAVLRGGRQVTPGLYGLSTVCCCRGYRGDSSPAAKARQAGRDQGHP